MARVRVCLVLHGFSAAALLRAGVHLGVQAEVGCGVSVCRALLAGLVQS